MQTITLNYAKLLRLFQHLLILLLCCAILSCTKAQPTLAKLSPDATIVAFGDSLTYGSGVKPENSYPHVLASLTSLKVVNAGVPGETSAQGLKRLPEILDQYQPQLIILCHGGNDLLRKLDKAQLANNLASMIQLSRDRGIDVIMLGVPEPKLLFMESAPLYQELAEKQNLPINTSVIPSIVSDNSLKSDNVHPNARGYKMMADAVYQLMQQSGSL